MKKILWELLSMFYLDFFCPEELGCLPVIIPEEFCLMAVKRCLAELPDEIPSLLNDLDEISQLGQVPCLVFKKESSTYNLKLVVSHIDSESEEN